MPKETDIHDDLILDRQTLLSNGNERRSKIEKIPGLGHVKIRSLKERERSQFETDALDDDGDLDRDSLLTAKRRLIILCVVDANLEPLLTDADLDALANKDGAILNALYKVCAEFSGITETDLADLVGNSKSTPANASPTS